LTCGDYVTSSSYHSVIAQPQRVVQFFNFSASVLLPLLRDEVTRTLGKSLSLVSAVATRWTSTWRSAVSALQVCDALHYVFTSAEAKARVIEAMTSRSVKYENLKDVIEIVQSPTFFEDLGERLDAPLPTIEASIVCQGGSVTMNVLLWPVAPVPRVRR
jgi:hypothetical protein